MLLVVALLLAAGGVWLLLRRRAGPGFLAGRSAHKLQIEETRSLGNRQYLVVAVYEEQKLLLGVTPGQIQLLTPLSTGEGKP
jgi:flagellar protein FliO/FliZ